MAMKVVLQSHLAICEVWARGLKVAAEAFSLAPGFNRALGCASALGTVFNGFPLLPFFAIFALVVCASHQLFAATVSLNPVADAYIDSLRMDSIHSNLFVGTTGANGGP